MATVSGTQSYLAWGQQTGFGTPQGTLVTAGNLRSGDVFTNPATVRPRLSTGGTIPIAAANQSWREYLVSDWAAGFEFVNSPNWQGLLTAAFGKVNVVAFVRTYTCFNPYQGTVDGTPNFYNHLLTLRHAFSGATGWEISDAAVSQFSLSIGMDAPTTLTFAGKGHKFAAAAAPTFTEVTGAIFPWDKYGMTANAGIYLDSSAIALNTAAMALPLKRMTFTLDNNIQYEALMAIVAGSEMRSPTRGSLASAMIQVETLYDTTMTQKDADEIFAYYSAGTNVNFQARGYNGAADIIDLKVTNQSGILQSPKISINGDGIVGFSFGVSVLPIALTDLSLVTTGGA